MSTQAGDIAAHGPAEEPLLRALGEHASDLALLCDRDAVILYAGPSVEKLFGYPREAVIGSSGWGFVNPDDLESVRARWDEMVAHPGVFMTWEACVLHADGSVMTIEVRATNMLDDPTIGGVVVNVHDVTTERHAERAFAAQQDFYRTILAAAQEGIWVITRGGRTLFANERMAEIAGIDPAQMHDASPADFLDPDTFTHLRAALADSADRVRGHFEVPYTRADGQRRWVSISSAPLYDADGIFTAAVATCVDVTDRRWQEREMRTLALHDSLTNLPNRTLLSDRLAQACDRHERTGEHVAVLFCDVDRFKLVNDNAGLTAGDSVLVQVAERLRLVCRDDDTVARFGGDEFVVLCQDADTYVASRLAEDIRAAFVEPYDVASTPFTLDVSVGVASTSDVAAGELLQAADRALRRAKARGRGRIEVHDKAMRRSTQGQLRLLSELRRAIANDCLDLHHQPIVDNEGVVVGVESLLRWTHPELGAISPAEIVRLAEDNAMMPRLGEWTLRRACVDIARLVDGGNLNVAVNLSARQLAEPAIVESVERALAVSGLAPSRLTLEVTETSMLDDIAVTGPILHRLKQIGVRIALDDFGTGYSSLTHLRDFPVDAIKIDRSFIAGMTTDSDDLAIVATLTNLAATVGLDVVAEGVETAEQAELARRLGATYAQGFLWSPAVPASELPDLLRPGRFRPMPTDLPRRRSRPRAGESLPSQDSDRARIIALHRSGASPATIAAAMNAEGHFTAKGTRWHRNTVAQVIAEATYPDLA